MGYCSDVQCLIYGDPLVVDALWAEFKDKPMVWPETFSDATPGEPHTLATEFAGCIDFVDDAPVRVLRLVQEGVKWYESYPDVIAWMAMVSEAEERGLCTEFIRVGEEPGDIEIYRSGGDLSDYLNTSTVITSSL